MAVVIISLHWQTEPHSLKDDVSFSATISACEKGGQWETALSLLNRMPQATSWKGGEGTENICKHGNLIEFIELAESCTLPSHKMMNKAQWYASILHAYCIVPGFVAQRASRWQLSITVRSEFLLAFLQSALLWRPVKGCLNGRWPYISSSRVLA